jgi:adenylate cyclase
MKVPLHQLRHCLEGLIPSTIATCAPDGTPNVTYLSHVSFVDEEHVALSFQFFNKTKRNVALNPRVAVMLVDSRTCRQYVLDLLYVRTQTSGPLFEQMRARLAGVAAMTGMTGVFELKGADVYRVLDYRPADRGYVPEPPERAISAMAVRFLTAEIGGREELSALLDTTLRGLAEHLGYEHSMVLMADPGCTRLYAVASHGYPASGAGAEVAFGEDVIGVAAAERQPVRITHVGRELAYNRIVRQRVAETGGNAGIEREIALLGLPDAQSKIAVPLLARGRLIGVLYLESAEIGRFLDDDERTLVSIAGHLGTAILLCDQTAANAPAAAAPPGGAAKPAGQPLVVRRFEADQSIFFGDDYLIKGVAGAILWKLLNAYAQEGRTEFSNRELRLDPSIGLPDIADNLEARLVLLMRRLKDRSEHIRLDKVARGRVRLGVTRPLELRSVARA